MVNILLSENDRTLSKRGVIAKLFSPACGAEGMLSIAEDRLRQLNPSARLEVFAQEKVRVTEHDYGIDG
jgi:type I restriction enzyme M protein